MWRRGGMSSVFVLFLGSNDSCELLLPSFPVKQAMEMFHIARGIPSILQCQFSPCTGLGFVFGLSPVYCSKIWEVREGKTGYQ